MTLIIPFLAVIWLLTTIQTSSGDCLLRLDSSAFPETQPLLLKSEILESPPTINQISAFHFPIDPYGTIILKENSHILIACPGTSNRFQLSHLGSHQIMKCSNTKFQLLTSTSEDPSYNFPDLRCKFPAEHITKVVNQSGNFLEIEIGFQVSNVFINHITIHFDKEEMRTIYTEFYMGEGIRGFQKKFPRSFFVEAGFYSIRVDSAYNRAVEKCAFETLLGSTDLAKRYINNDLFINRGHLVAKCDFVFGAQQSLTFYHINSAPQWEACNSGNWNNLEMSLRDLAAYADTPFRVLTGTFGACKLPNVNGDLVEIYLSVSENGQKKTLIVPKYFWKVIYNEVDQKGIAVIVNNNPFLNKSEAENDIFCKNIKQTVSWLKWYPSNLSIGHGFCCEISDFAETVTWLPNLTVTEILKY